MNQDLNLNDDIFYDEKRENLNKIVTGTNTFKFKCSGCGNKFVTQTKINHCTICNSNNISEEEYDGSLDSLLVIPFVKTKEEAIKNYKKKTRWNPLVPFAFKNRNVFQAIKKVYVKNLCANLKINGETTFIGTDKDGSNRKYKVILNSNFDYENILGNSILKINANLIDEISDYNFNNLTNFDKSYLTDEVLIIDNEISFEAEKIKNSALKCSLNIIKDNVKHHLKKLDKNNLLVDVNLKKEVLVPMYILNIKYGEKNYYYLMNGVTGKDTIDFPIGKLELILFCCLFFLIVFGIAFLIAYFL